MPRIPGHRSTAGRARRGSGWAGGLAVILATMMGVLTPLAAAGVVPGASAPIALPGNAATASVATNADAPVVNVLTNGDVEDGGTAPAGWTSGGYQPQNATFSWDATTRHAGARSLGIDTGAVSNDVRWTQDFSVPAPPLGPTVHRYRLSGWIKTEGVNGGYGASLGNADTFDRTVGISGTTDWTYVSMVLQASAGSQLHIAVRLGHFGAISTGRAWFDDIQLVDLAPPPSDQPPGWKILVLVYPTMDLTTGGHHYVGTMSNADRDNAIATATQFVNQDIPALDSGFMVPDITVRVVPQAPRLSPDGGGALGGLGGWWPAPGDTASERDPAFDSVIVVWNAHGVDESNHQVDINSYCGLTPGLGTNQTYSTIVATCDNTNTFKHEFGHSITFYHDALGAAPKPTVNNHIDPGQPDTNYVHCPTGVAYVMADEQPGNPIPNSIYNNQSGFTHDYYSGTTALAANPTQCLGIPRSAWAYGGPLTLAGDLNPPSISVADAAVPEGGAGTTTQLSFTVTLSHATSTQPVSVSYRTVPGTAISPEDFATASGVVTFAPGQTTATVAVTVEGDSVVEQDESFSFQLDDAVNAFLAGGTAAGTIINDDLPPLEGLADPSLSPLMNALSGVILDGTGNKVMGLAPPCAMTGPYLGLSDIDKLNLSIQANDGCLQFVTVFGGTDGVH